MKIEIRDEYFTLILSNDELDNDNFVDIELLGDEAKNEDNPRGYLGEGTVPIDELKSAVDAFYQLRKQRLEREKLLN